MRKFLNLLPYILILIVAGILRFLWLDKFPAAITGDELTYVLNAKSFFLTGKDLTQSVSIFQYLFFQYPINQFPQAELPFFLLYPFVGPLPFSLVVAHLPYAILSFATVFVIFLLTKELFGKTVAIFASLLCAINPWSIFIGRTAYEVVPATFFYCLGIYLLIKLKGWKAFYSLPIFILAFYSYIATKLIFAPVILVTLLFTYFNLSGNKSKKPYITFGLTALIIPIVYVVLLSLHPSTSRLGELLTPSNMPGLADQVNNLRKITIATPLLSIFINKYTIYLSILVGKLFAVFSPSYLFIHGDLFYGIPLQGLFYPIDAMFLIIGIAYSLKANVKASFFLFALIIIAALPQVFHKTTSDFTPHNALIIPFILILIGLGIKQAIFLSSKKYWQISVVIFIALFYLYAVGNFTLSYFYQYPLQGRSDFPLRVVSHYISLNPDRSITIYSTKSSDEFSKYLFYGNLKNSNLKNGLDSYLSGKSKLGNVTYIGCNDTIDPSKSNNLILVDNICGKITSKASSLYIRSFADAGVNFTIYNDSLCKNYSMHTLPLSTQSFGIEKLPASTFCSTFISY